MLKVCLEFAAGGSMAHKAVRLIPAESRVIPAEIFFFFFENPGSTGMLPSESELL